MFGCSRIPRKLGRFLECENDWMQNSSYWKSFDWLQQRINNNLGKFSDPSAVLSFPPVCCHMVQSDRACSLSRCWLLYLALQQVVWGAGCDLTDISVSGTARQDTTYLSLSLSSVFPRTLHYGGRVEQESLNTRGEDVEHDDEGPHWPSVRHNKVGSILTSPHLQRPSVTKYKVWRVLQCVPALTGVLTGVTGVGQITRHSLWAGGKLVFSA